VGNSPSTIPNPERKIGIKASLEGVMDCVVYSMPSGDLSWIRYKSATGLAHVRKYIEIVVWIPELIQNLVMQRALQAQISPSRYLSP
jgi:hypothetical protein